MSIEYDNHGETVTPHHKRGEKGNLGALLSASALGGVLGGASQWYMFKNILKQLDEEKYFSDKSHMNGSEQLARTSEFLAIQDINLPKSWLDYGIVTVGVVAGAVCGYKLYREFEKHQNSQNQDTNPSSQIDATTAQRDTSLSAKHTEVAHAL
jgi:hypothetical protein